ncbi:14 kDa proline-rich protein DC2.15-like protein [Corchorus capsularis]|uniref:14 kDa proline-rich protein DC2.15-like protein n=1 Tax=Corchorus capsularis TaxID=210143 RepID=A0A1R3IKL2_COCAP|nr:14 kDa proline-rich protein DC2.15-like protein [Corchorus capsularis]
MAYSNSKASAAIALLLALNLLFSTMASASLALPPPLPPPPSTCTSILSLNVCTALASVVSVNGTLALGSNPSNPCCRSILGLVGANANVCPCILLKFVRHLLPFLPLVDLKVAVSAFNNYCNTHITACI